jgi:hypothetical protein
LDKLTQWITGCKNAMKNTEDGYFTSLQLTAELASLDNPKWTDQGKVEQDIQRAMKEGKMMEKQTSSGARYTWRD